MSRKGLIKTPPIKTILYATDLGKHMRPVFRRAIQLAQVHDARIVMLHIIEPLTGTGQAIVDTYLSSKKREQMQHDGMKKVLETMRARIDKFCEDELGEGIEESTLVSDVVVHSGRAGDEIPRQALDKQADLIVMGTCSHGLLGRGLLGSTAARVVQTSRVPVLVVPNCHQ
ncbi:MAG: universal stress protein [Thiohalocapsa sp.]|nr:universal stress protein [Thiohalocapsa sp.]MCF7989923.1 universal stress protein [Thiohalocapsa sp.]